MSSRDYRHDAWYALSGRWGFFIGVCLLYALVTSILSSIPGVGPILTLVISGPLAVGLVGISIKIIRNESTKINDLLDGFNCFGEAFLLQLLNGLFVFLWSLLLLIPGIVKAYAYSMSTYILADNPNISQKQARQKSEQLMIGHKFDLFVLDFSFIGWYLLGILTLGILFIWVIPYQYAARASFYNDLVTNSETGNYNINKQDYNQYNSDNQYFRQ